MERKTDWRRGICWLLVWLLLFAGCNGSPEQPEDTEPVTSQNEKNEFYHLRDFQIVRADQASGNIIEATLRLNRSVKTAIGSSLRIGTDWAQTPEAGCEILIGAVNRVQTREAFAELTEEEYVIRTVPTESGMKLLLGGKSEEATLRAIAEFEQLLENHEVENGDGVMNTLNIKASAMAGLDAEQAKKLAILYDKSSNSYVLSAIRCLRASLRKAYPGSDIPLVALNAESDISGYPYALVIGSIGEQASAMTKQLGKKTYQVQTEASENGYRAYLLGENGMAVLRAIQRFYTRAVVDGCLQLPLYVDETVTAQEIRDPCILVYQGKYYVYENNGTGYAVRVSEDLLTWSEKRPVFDRSDSVGFPGTQSFWAPEVHEYRGAFYLFGTYYDETTGKRGTAIFRSDVPNGKFVPWSDGFLTPKDRHSIDGTLYVQDGVPYMVYVDEWPNYGSSLNHSKDSAKGRMAYVQLSDDLKTTVGEYHNDLFRADDPEWSNYGITDGPWLYKCENGRLLMLWSNRDSAGNYCVGIAVSSNGKLDGTWTQCEKPLVTANNSNVYCVTEGGHGMIFHDLNGRMFLSIHTPNSGEDIALTLIPLVERDGMLYVDVVR